MTHWLGRGAGGWRLDAAYAVPPSFWAKAVPAVREAFPGAWFLGEMIHGDYAAYAAEAGLDSITQYEVWKAVWSSLNDRNFYELDHALGRHNAFMDGELRADVRRQPRRDQAGDGPERRPALLARPRRPVLHRRRAERLLRRRAGVPRPQGEPRGRRRRDQARVPRLSRRAAARRVALLPAAPAADRLPPASPVAGPRPHGGRAPGAVRAGPAAARRGRGEQALLLLNTGDSEFRFAVDAGGLSVAETAERSAGRRSPTRCSSRRTPGRSWLKAPGQPPGSA